jgi:hypothetical protein
MSYESTMNLVNIRIRANAVPYVTHALETKKVKDFSAINGYLEHLMIDDEGMLSFKAKKDGSDAYAPFDDGSVPARTGKWQGAKQFASWVKQHCDKGGRIVMYSWEADGAAWGWEFDGKSRMRYMELTPAGKWE